MGKMGGWMNFSGPNPDIRHPFSSKFYVYCTTIWALFVGVRCGYCVPGILKACTLYMQIFSKSLELGSWAAHS